MHGPFQRRFFRTPPLWTCASRSTFHTPISSALHTTCTIPTVDPVNMQYFVITNTPRRNSFSCRHDSIPPPCAQIGAIKCTRKMLQGYLILHAVSKKQPKRSNPPLKPVCKTPIPARTPPTSATFSLPHETVPTCHPRYIFLLPALLVYSFIIIVIQ